MDGVGHEYSRWHFSREAAKSWRKIRIDFQARLTARKYHLRRAEDRHRITRGIDERDNRIVQAAAWGAYYPIKTSQGRRNIFGYKQRDRNDQFYLLTVLALNVKGNRKIVRPCFDPADFDRNI